MGKYTGGFDASMISHDLRAVLVLQPAFGVPV
jgi:hypothetical protein